MGVVVSLSEVASEWDVPSDEWTVFISRKTGEVVPVGEEEAALVESMVDPGSLAEAEELAEQLPDWQAEMLPKLVAVLNGDEFLALPSKHDLDAYGLMERFSAAVEDARVSTKLLRAIQGRGAFRRFKDTAAEHGLLERWYDYRQQALEELLAEWLTENGFEFTRE